MSNVSDAAELSGPVRPTASADVVHRPVAGQGTRLTGGLLHDWQQRSSEVSLPLAVTQMEAAGNLGNLRLAISGGDPAAYRGPAFMDSDIYKTLEAVSWELSRDAGTASDPALAAFAAEATDLLVQAQQPDGYLNSHIQVTGKPRYAQLASSHELYCAGHLIQAAIAAHRTAVVLEAAGTSAAAPDFKATADSLFAVATRFADHLVDHFLGHEGNDGHPIIETALAELYRETGHEPYLRLASQFLEQRGHGHIGDSGFGSRYLQDHLPVRENPTEVGHAVRALYLEAGIADVAAETGDRGLLAASVDPVGRHGRHQDRADRGQRLPALGRGVRRRVRAAARPGLQRDLRGHRQLPVELAAAAGHRRGPVRRPDGAAALQRVRRVGLGRRAALLLRQPAPAARRPLRERPARPPPGVVLLRLLPAQHHADQGLAPALSGHRGRRRALPAPVHRVGTSPPSSRRAPRSWRCGPGTRGRAGSRSPSARRPRPSSGWPSGCPRGAPASGSPSDGQPLAAAAEGGYLVARRHWQPGDVLTLDLDVRPRLTYPSRRTDALRGTVAVERGPLVYCFEQADHGEVSIEDLAVTRVAPWASSPRPTALGESVAVTVPAVHLPAAPARLPGPAR